MRYEPSIAQGASSIAQGLRPETEMTQQLLPSPSGRGPGCRLPVIHEHTEQKILSLGEG